MGKLLIADLTRTGRQRCMRMDMLDLSGQEDGGFVNSGLRLFLFQVTQ